MSETNFDYDPLKIWVFVSIILSVLVLVASLIMKCFSSKTVAEKPIRKLNIVLIAFTLPLIVMLLFTTSHTRVLEQEIKQFHLTFDSSFSNSTFFFLGMKDFTYYLKLLKSKMANVEEQIVKKVYLDGGIESTEVVSSIESDLQSLYLSSQNSQIFEEMNFEVEELKSAFEVLRSLSDEFVEIAEQKAEDRKLKIDAVIENASYIFGTYRDVSQLISKKVTMVLVLYLVLTFICVVFSILLLVFYFRKASEGQGSRNPEKAIAFVAMFLALIVMAIGLGSGVVFLSVQKGVEKTHPGPLKALDSRNSTQSRGKKLVLASVDAIDQREFLPETEVAMLALTQTKTDETTLFTAREVLKKSSEVKRLLRDYSVLVKEMASNLGDIDLLVKQINNKIAISNFNYPIAKHIEILGEKMGTTLKQNANTLSFLASMLFVAALADILRILIFS